MGLGKATWAYWEEVEGWCDIISSIYLVEVFFYQNLKKKADFDLDRLYVCQRPYYTKHLPATLYKIF